MLTCPYHQQVNSWPQSGKHILAQYDASSIVVYQAYRTEIGKFATINQYFGGAFSYNRMSWIKPNFLWMMYRSGWGTKDGQEITLAVRLKRSFFDKIITLAVISSFQDCHSNFSHKEWKEQLKTSKVRLQWDPDHDPMGRKLTRKALQLGLRDDILMEYGKEAIIEITDISDFVAAQRPFATGNFTQLITPTEQIYWPDSPAARKNIGLDNAQGHVS